MFVIFNTMKKAFYLLSILLLSSLLSLAQGAKKRILIEHFTNTYCSRCPSGNANLEAVLANYQGEYHKISFNPSVPYTQCSFYQANTVDNGARESFYGISFTPVAYLWGKRGGLGNAMLSQAQMDAAMGMTSPLEVVVSETSLSPNGVRVSVNLNIHDTIPTGDYRLFVALIEKTVQFNAPNGETVHHDVFRKMLTDPQGLVPTLPAVGNYFQYKFDASYDASWAPTEMYALAFVQEENTKEVLNSGTRFDLSNTSVNPRKELSNVSIYPNPTTDYLFLDFETDNVSKIDVKLTNILGQMLYKAAPDKQILGIDLNFLNKGTYFLHISKGDALFVSKIIKQ